MSEIKHIINGMEFRKWGIIPYFFLAFFGNFGEQVIPQDSYLQSSIYTVDAHQRIFERIADAGHSSLRKLHEYVEIEYDENDGDHHHLNNNSSQSLSLLLVPVKITSIFLIPPKVKVKLFILYLSWKSFLRH